MRSLVGLIYALLRVRQLASAATQASVPSRFEESAFDLLAHPLWRGMEELRTSVSNHRKAPETSIGISAGSDTHTLQKRFGSWVRVPRFDDPRAMFMNGQCELRGLEIDVERTWKWVDGWCDPEGNVRIRCHRLGYHGRDPETSYRCHEDQMCVETDRWKNYLGKTAGMAMCVPRTYNRLMEKVKRLGRWRSGLMCGIGGVATESGVRSAMVEMAVQVHRRPVPESHYSDEIKANQVFMWDVTHGAYDLLGEEDKVSRASVAITLQNGHPRYIKCCVTIPDYWQLRQDEVWVNFTHSYQYNKIMMTKKLPGHLLHPTTILASNSTAD